MDDADPRATALHRTIFNDVTERIMSGDWRPGERLPFETELAERYGCSRMTVNKAMTQLARAGLVERHRKSGSFVAQPHAQSAVLEIRDIEAEVRSLGLSYRYELFRRGSGVAGVAQGWPRGAGAVAPPIEVACVHWAGDRPFCLEERAINTAIVPEAADADFSAVPPGRWLVTQVPWSAAEHRIEAMSASPETSRRLGVDAGSACLVVERQTWNAAGPVTWVRFTYPGQRHSLVARFTPTSG